MGLPKDPDKKLEAKLLKPARPDTGQINSDSTNPAGPRFEQKWLAEQSKDDLIKMILELKAELSTITGRLNEVAATPPAPQSVAPKTDIIVKQFVPLPAATSGRRNRDFTWRLTLISLSRQNPPLGLAIHGDVFVGRAVSGVTPDLDLTEYGGESLGVSRQHALLRPTEKGLLLIDLQSTNGTSHNGKKLTPLKAQMLAENDTIAFGQLHFSIRLVKLPKEASDVSSDKGIKPAPASGGSSKPGDAGSETKQSKE